MRSLLALSLLLGLGCTGAAPHAKATCAGPLGGTWRSEGDPRLRYRVVDRGRDILLEPLFPIGGPYGAFRTTLRRDGTAAPRGSTETSYTEQGKRCPVRFAARIEACTERSLELVSETQFDIRVATCEVSRTGATARARLVRETP